MVNKLEYTEQDLTEVEVDAYNRGFKMGFKMGFKKGMIDCYKKSIESIEKTFEKYRKTESEVE